MTKRFARSLWRDDLEPKELKECLDHYYGERKEAFADLEVGSILINHLCYGDVDEFEITKINKKTGEVTVEFHGSVGM